jgi:lipoic acid synthetase
VTRLDPALPAVPLTYRASGAGRLSCADAGEGTAGTPLPFRHKRPAWLTVRAPWGQAYRSVEKLVRGEGLHTVCEEARCPNIGECWGSGTATFLILGDVCTRRCGFCAVATGFPRAVDPCEPERVADAVCRLGVRHAVITSVNRDELPDGGASVFAACIRRVREQAPQCSIEVLIPDFKGDAPALTAVMVARPDILNHNVETVPRLYRRVRPQASYRRSLELLRRAKEADAAVLTKSGVMVGLGETRTELEAVMRDLVDARVDILTIGQYLRPSEHHLPIQRYYTPDEFDEFRELGESLGLRWVESGPLVRSSFRAARQAAELRRGA